MASQSGEAPVAGQTDSVPASSAAAAAARTRRLRLRRALALGARPYTRSPVNTSSSPVSARSGDRVRVGVAGLGAVAQAVHLPLLARLGDTFEIAAICDLSPALRATLGDRYRVAPNARYATVEELVDEEALDGLILLTSGSHGAAALAALDRGLPILCEKPLAYTVTEADRLAESHNAARLLLGYMKAFDPAVEEAARLVADPATGLGPCRAIEVTVLHPTSES